MEDKYVCPLCKSKIIVWESFQKEARQTVNPKTGKLSKVTYTKLEPIDHMFGFKCTNKECSWIVNIVNEIKDINDDDWNDYLKELSNRI